MGFYCSIDDLRNPMKTKQFCVAGAIQGFTAMFVRGAQHFLQFCMCASRSLRSDCASAQSDQIFAEYFVISHDSKGSSREQQSL